MNNQNPAPTAAQLERQNQRDPRTAKYTSYIPAGADRQVTDQFAAIDPLDAIAGDPIVFSDNLDIFKPEDIGKDRSVFMAVDVLDLGRNDVEVTGITEFSFFDLTPEGLTPATWLGKLDRKMPAVLAFLEERYSASVDLPDFEEELEQIRFSTIVKREELSREQAYHAAVERTGALRFKEEASRSENGDVALSGLLNEHLNNSFVLPNRYDTVRALTDVNDGDEMEEVRAKHSAPMGSPDPEISDVNALACARYLAHYSPVEAPELTRLTRHGWCNQEKALAELARVYDEPIADGRIRANMLGTWMLAKLRENTL